MKTTTSQPARESRVYDMGTWAHRERMYRMATLGCVALTLLLVIHMTATSSLSRASFPVDYTRGYDPGSAHFSNAAQSSDCQFINSPSTRPADRKPQIANQSRMLEITANNRNLVYLHKADILLMTMAKAGTSTTWHWLYPGVTGRKVWDMDACKTYVHDMRSDCWGSDASFVYSLNPEEQWRVLATSNSTLRVAIQRNPYERVISSFKSKFTCEHERFSTDVHNRETMVPILRHRCGMPDRSWTCMNVSEFAQTLDSCRQHVGKPGYVSSLRLLDVHIRPQEFFFDEIDYDMVIDVNDLSDVNVVAPLINRVQYKDLVQNGPRVRHSSGHDQLSIPERAAAMLYAYAAESKPGKLKYVPGHEPTMTSSDDGSIEDDD